MTGRSRVVLLLSVLAGAAVLVSLGTWQVQRLHWKRALNQEIEERAASAPRPLLEVEQLWSDSGDVEDYPVTVAGRFQHEHEQYVLATHDGVSGWHVYTPLLLDSGRSLMVNRGFVPYPLRDPQSRPDSQPPGRREFTGLSRNPLREKPNRFVPDNDPAARTYYWKDLGRMAQAAGLEPDALVPFFVDSADTGGSGLPLGGTTILRYPDNHLQYAVTWYGLAAALLAVGGILLIGDLRRR